jgi:hypothetical protein
VKNVGYPFPAKCGAKFQPNVCCKISAKLLLQNFSQTFDAKLQPTFATPFVKAEQVNAC